jgi:hypothetical protein
MSRRMLFLLIPVVIGTAAIGALWLGRSGEGDGESIQTATTPSTEVVTSVYNDDFSHRRWSERESDFSQVSYLDQQLRIVTKKRCTCPLASPAPVFAGSVRVEVDTVGLSPTTALATGVYCRRTSETPTWNYYGLVDGNGYWRISRYRPESGTEAVLMAGTDTPIQASQAVRIGLDCVGDDSPGSPVVLRLRLNGKVVGEATDRQGLGIGGTGVVVLNRQDQVDVRFDNFVISKL